MLYFVTARGLKESATWTMRGGGKRGDLRQSDNVAKQFRASIVDGLTKQLNETMPLVLCGPGKNRDRMLADLKSAGHRRPMMSIGTSMGGRGGANEVLRDGLAGEMLSEHRMVQEISHLEEAWRRISTNGAVAYGHRKSLKPPKKERLRPCSLEPMCCETKPVRSGPRGPALPNRWKPSLEPWSNARLTMMRVSN